MVNKKLNNKAVVLLSGGLDSATVLAIALDQGFHCTALSFDYGQRHIAELTAAKKIVQHARLEQHKIISLDLTQIGGSALTDSSIAVPTQSNQAIPITYVPARNTIFLSYALAFAEVTESDHLFIGVNAVDYSGYPDCRPEYIKAFSAMAALATRTAIERNPIKIHTPLIQLSKSSIVQLGTKLGVDYSLTVSCYQANDSGKACGRCDSCHYRKTGFLDAGLVDPTLYQ